MPRRCNAPRRRCAAGPVGADPSSVGFGLAHGDRHYALGPDLCLPLEPITPTYAWNHAVRLPAAELAWTIDGPIWIGTHDRDVALDLKSFAQLLADLGPGVRYLGYREYCAYLHARVERAPAADGALALRVRYDEWYGGYFKDRPSQWTLHLADDTRRAIKPSAPERQITRLAPGLGAHVVKP